MTVENNKLFLFLMLLRIFLFLPYELAVLLIAKVNIYISDFCMARLK
jgi:hypothetical protein